MSSTECDAITERLGGFPQVGTAVRDPECVPDNIVIGKRPTKPCEHDFIYLCTYGEMNSRVSSDQFYCRRCLEYREVQR